MRRHNRQIDIFGMASLDLFASAMGAFILIAIVIFPYVRNADPAPVAPAPPVVAAVEPAEPMEPPPEPAACPVCLSAPAPAPVCPVVPAPEDADDPPVCPVCPSVAPAPECPSIAAAAPPPVVPARPTAARPAERVTQFPHLDLVIVLDVTSSMGRQVASLKTEVGQLSDLLNRLSPSLGIGIVAFGDRYWERPLTVFPLREVSGPTLNRSAFRGFVNDLAVGMGRGRGRNSDGPEAVLMALAEAARMQWRPHAEQRVIVLVTDNTAYPEELNSSILTAAQIARGTGHRVSTVYINTTGASDAVAESFLQQVANAGRGQFVRDVGGSLTVNLLLSLL